MAVELVRRGLEVTVVDYQDPSQELEFVLPQARHLEPVTIDRDPGGMFCHLAWEQAADIADEAGVARAAPAWCEALVQIPGWARSLRVYSVDLPWRSSVEQRSQAEWLATRIAELRELGELAVAGGNWNSYGHANPVMPGALEAAPRALAAIPDAVLTPRSDPETELRRARRTDQRRHGGCSRRCAGVR